MSIKGGRHGENTNGGGMCSLYYWSGTGKKLKSMLKVGDVNRMVYTCYF